MSREPLNPDLANLEAALTGLRPSPSALDRDRLMFQAGQAAGRRRTRLAVWVGAGTTTAAMLAACVVGVALLQRPAADTKQQTAHTPAAQSGQAIQSSWAGNWPAMRKRVASGDAGIAYLQLRQLVLTRGFEALPRSRRARPEVMPLPMPIQRRLSINCYG